jgi:hypothetical protein
LVAGGSNAKFIHLPSLRIIRGTGELVAQKLKDEMSWKTPATMVLQLLDNSIFEALTVEGSRVPPGKCKGKHHLDGDIAVAEKATVIGMLRICMCEYLMTQRAPGINPLVLKTIVQKSPEPGWS